MQKEQNESEILDATNEANATQNSPESQNVDPQNLSKSRSADSQNSEKSREINLQNSEKSAEIHGDNQGDRKEITAEFSPIADSDDAQNIKRETESAPAEDAPLNVLDMTASDFSPAENAYLDAEPSTEKEQILAAKARADHEAAVLSHLADDFASSSKRTFRRTVIMSIGSVVFLLILAIIFFIFLHWYAVGAGVAIIAFIVAQVWLHFFKKWNYNANNTGDFADDFDDILPAHTDKSGDNAGKQQQAEVNDKTDK